MAANPAEQRRADFYRIFNEAIGNAHGRPLTYASDARIRNATSDADKIRAALIAYGNAAKKSSTKKTKKEPPGPANPVDLLALGSQGPLKIENGQIKVSDLPDTAQHRKPFSGGLWDDIKDRLYQGQEKVLNNPVMDTLQDNPVNRAVLHPLKFGLEAAGRAGSSITSGIYAADKQSESSQNILKILGAGWHGTEEAVVHGKTHGFGEVIDKPPIIVTMGEKMLAQMDEKGVSADDPRRVKLQAAIDKGKADYADKTGFEQWSHRVAGLAGDTLLDPTSLIKVKGLTTAAKYAGGLNKGKKVVETLTKEGAKTTGKAIRRGQVDVGKAAVLNETKRHIAAAIDPLEHPELAGKTVSKGVAKKGEAAVRGRLEDEIGNEVAKRLDPLITEMRNGKLIGADASIHGTVAQTAAETVRDTYWKRLEPMRAKFLHAQSISGDAAEAIAKKMKGNPLFDRWYNFAKEAADPLNPKSIEQINNLADRAFLDSLSPRIDDVYNKMLKSMKDATMRVPVLEVAGANIPLPGLARVGKKIASSPLLDNYRVQQLDKMFRYASHLPGYSSHIVNNLHSLNHQNYEVFRKDLKKAFEGTTKAERQQIHTAIEKGIVLDDPRLAKLQEFTKQKYKEMYDEEILNKVRNRSVTPEADNYVYNRVKTSDHNFDTNWANKKRDWVRQNGNLGPYTSKEIAAKRFYSTNTDAADALLARKAKSLRKSTTTLFDRDLVHHYGFVSKMNPKEAVRRNLVMVNKDRFPDLYKNLGKDERIFIDKRIHEIGSSFRNITRQTPAWKQNVAARGLANATSVFKRLNTIAYPAFHIRNMASDIMMGLLDGVHPGRYEQVMKAFLNKDKSLIKVGGHEIPFKDVYDSYYNRAASAGFWENEVGLPEGKVGLSARNIGSKITRPLSVTADAARKLSTKREDFGRLVHYYHAMDDEMRHQLKSGKSWKEAWNAAEIGATDRVNTFKFDYNALTPAEKNIKTYGMPFYTYMRKATPLLAQTLAMNPKYLSRIDRLQRALAPDQTFADVNVPQWVQDLNPLEIKGGDKPVSFTDAWLPTRTLSESFQKLPAKLNPFAQMVFEFGSGKDTFTGQPIKGNGFNEKMFEILKNKYRGISTYRNIENDKKPTVDKLASLTGVPLVQINDARKNSRMKELNDEVHKRLSTMNDALEQKGLKMVIRNQKIYLIRPSNKKTSSSYDPNFPERDKDEVVGTYNNFNEINLKF